MMARSAQRWQRDAPFRHHKRRHTLVKIFIGFMNKRTARFRGGTGYAVTLGTTLCKLQKAFDLMYERHKNL
jgi:hypothetical protein